MSDAPTIDGFEHIELIGSGGFADVHLYRQRMPSRTVAVKILRSAELTDAIKRQFIVEANVMARLSNHPGIATIYTAGITSDDRPYLVMEYCPGGSLAERYRKAPLPIAEAVSIGIRMAAALESAHRVGVVHRDVKPANILVTEYGSPVLTDFGIALGHEAALESTLLQGMSASGATRDGSGLAYSVPWAAPEVLLESDANDALSDVYSLAATVRTLVEGVSPFEIVGGNNSLLSLSRRVESGSARQWTRDDVPSRLREVLEKAMSLTRRERYQSALDFAHALRSVETLEGVRTTGIELLGANPTTEVDYSQSNTGLAPGEADRTVLRGREAASALDLLSVATDSPTEMRAEASGLSPVESGNGQSGSTRDGIWSTRMGNSVSHVGRLRKRNLIAAGVLIAGAALGLGAWGVLQTQLSSQGFPKCAEVAWRSDLVPFSLPTEVLRDYVPEDMSVNCAFSVAGRDQHVIVIDGGRDEFDEVVSSIADATAPELCVERSQLELERGLPLGGCNYFDDGSFLVRTATLLEQPFPDDDFGFVPRSLTSAVVVNIGVS